jgi:hypothetical protein
MEAHILVSDLQHIGLLCVELEGQEPNLAIAFGPGDKPLTGAAVHTTRKFGDEVFGLLNSHRSL